MNLLSQIYWRCWLLYSNIGTLLIIQQMQRIRPKFYHQNPRPHLYKICWFIRNRCAYLYVYTKGRSLTFGNGSFSKDFWLALVLFASCDILSFNHLPGYRKLLGLDLHIHMQWPCWYWRSLKVEGYDVYLWYVYYLISVFSISQTECNRDD